MMLFDGKVGWNLWRCKKQSCGKSCVLASVESDMSDVFDKVRCDRCGVGHILLRMSHTGSPKSVFAGEDVSWIYI